MTPYIALSGMLPESLLHDLERAQSFVAVLPEASEEAPATATPDGRGGTRHFWSCHGIARALAVVLEQPWEVKDGWFLRKGQQHAWLAIASEGTFFVLDAYPIAAAGGPMLVDVSSLGSPWRGAFMETPAYGPEQIERFDAEGDQAIALWRRATGITAPKAGRVAA